MRRLVPAILIITAVAAGAWAVQSARGAVSQEAVRAAGSWGRAIGVPGLAALNAGSAEVDEVSCASAGNCAAIGSYTDRQHHSQGFVADEQNGRWSKAIEVPGLAALNKGESSYRGVMRLASQLRGRRDLLGPPP